MYFIFGYGEFCVYDKASHRKFIQLSIFRVPWACVLSTVYIRRYEQSCIHVNCDREAVCAFGSVGVLCMCIFRQTSVFSHLCNLGL